MINKYIPVNRWWQVTFVIKRLQVYWRPDSFFHPNAMAKKKVAVNTIAAPEAMLR
jgi:hypothetical protein